MLTIREAADTAGLSYWTIRNAIRRGSLPTVTFSRGVVRIEPRAFADWRWSCNAKALLRELLAAKGHTVSAVADRCGVSSWTVKAWIRSGRLPAERVPPAGYRVRGEDVERLLVAAAE